MVDNTDLMATHAKPTELAIEQQHTVSINRWIKHFSYMPWRTRYCFNQHARLEISQAVQHAEQGHSGEVQVIIEGHLPLSMAWCGNSYLRAKQLFAEYGVWDTAYNSGVLLYINLCERNVEIIADRGIHASVHAEHWQTICDQITQYLAKQHYLEGVLVGIQHIGVTLEQFYEKQLKDVGNELDDNAIFL